MLDGETKETTGSANDEATNPKARERRGGRRGVEGARRDRAQWRSNPDQGNRATLDPALYDVIDVGIRKVKLPITTGGEAETSHADAAKCAGYRPVPEDVEDAAIFQRSTVTAR